jgi:hypothetical protein
MPLILGLMAVVLVAQEPPSMDPRDRVKTVIPGRPVLEEPPHVAFEIRDIRVSSPDWRGKLMPRLTPVARQEGTAAWTLDPETCEDFFEICQADAKWHLVEAPKLITRVGEPAHMTAQESFKYVASLTRKADGELNQATNLAFVPEADEVHNGVRVEILGSQLQADGLLARMVIDESRIIGFHTTKYQESVKPRPGADPEVTKASFLERLNPKHDSNKNSIAATIQIPEVDTRRAEGEWVIPANGLLLVSLGPRTAHDKNGRKGYEEHLIAISAHPTEEAIPAPPRPLIPPSLSGAERGIPSSLAR